MILLMIAVMVQMKPKYYAKADTENVPNPNSNVQTVNVLPQDGDATTKTTAVI